MRTPDHPRVLQVVHALNRGGVERWLLHVLRHTPPGSWSTDFLVHSDRPGAYDTEIRALGSEIVIGPDLRTPTRMLARLGYLPRLRRLLLERGPYDVVHSHLHLFSGVVLRAAAEAGVPIRVAQANSSATDRGLPRSLYRMLMQHWLRKYATHRATISESAGAALFGPAGRGASIETVECALDFSPFLRLPSQRGLREQLGLPLDRTLLGHVGRFDRVKNHRFVVAVFAEMLRRGLDAELLLVGSGPLEAEVRGLAHDLGVLDRCVFTGGIDETTAHVGALDLMLFPSLHEGLALATLEAQAAGVPVLASMGVPAEAGVVPGLLHRRPLDEGPQAWAEAGCRILEEAATPDRVETAPLLVSSRFDATHSVQRLARLYGLSQAPRRPVGVGVA